MKRHPLNLVWLRALFICIAALALPLPRTFCTICSLSEAGTRGSLRPWLIE